MEILFRVQKIFQNWVISPIVKKIPSWIHPNQLTILRGILIIPIVLLILNGNLWSAALIYLIAAFSDGLDGELSRIRNKQTKLGRSLDPAIDRLLHLVIFLLFYQYSPFLFSILFVIELIILLYGGYILLKTKDSTNLPTPNIAGRWKFIFWASSVVCILFFEIYLSYFWYLLFNLFIILSIIFSLASVILYLLRKKL